MFENLSSIRASKDNLLRTKVKSFRENYSQSLQRTQTKSSLHNLASTVYSQKFNKEFTPSKIKSISNLSAKNPENQASSSAIKGVDMRASHIPNMSDINTDLLLNKRKLEESIMFLKEEIARETRARNKAETSWKILRNDKESCQQSYSEYCRKSNKLQESIAEMKSENSQLNQDIRKLKQQNVQTNEKKQHQSEVVNDLQSRVNFLKTTLLQEEKERSYVKGELLKDQRVMDSCSILNKQLQNEKAMLMIEINNSVALFKL